MGPTIEKEKKEDRDAPAFDFYPERWLAGTAHMTDAEQLSYLRLLCHQWTMDGLPCDEKVLRRLGGRGVTAMVLAKFPEMQGKLRNRRLELIRTDQRERIRNSSEKGRKGANKRWGKTSCESNAQASAQLLRGECPPPTTHLSPQDNNNNNNNNNNDSSQPAPLAGLGLGLGLEDEVGYGLGVGGGGGVGAEVEAEACVDVSEQEEEALSLELALRYAESYGKESGTGDSTGAGTGTAAGAAQSISAEQVHAWYDDRSKVGWVLVKGGEPLPVRAWKADLRSYVRTWESLERARPIKPKSASKSGGGAGGGSTSEVAHTAAIERNGSRTTNAASAPFRNAQPQNPPSVWSLQQQIEAVEKEKGRVIGLDKYKNLPPKRKERFDALCVRLNELNAMLTGVPLDVGA